ncbi:hypothetical protein [Dongia sp.]|uniref:hypothetical protein n=1 Tax=Dongia sp. TaxID=1977262 RepID=UPI0035B126ED
MFTVKQSSRLARALMVATVLASASACVSDEERSGPRAATSEDIWRLSGTKDAVSNLQQALSDACHVSLTSPDGYQKISPEGDSCVRTHMVVAFDAQEGSLLCGRDKGLQPFVSCILEGQFVGHVVANSGSDRLAPEVQWGGGEERSKQAANLLSERVKASCATPDQAALKKCVDETMLRAFEVDEKAVDFCPTPQQRDLCIYWAGFARSIRIKLERIGA